MKTLQIITLTLSLLLAAAFAQAQPAKDRKKAKSEVVVFDTGIHCESCKAKLEKYIPFEKGFKDMKVDVEKKTVAITYDPAKTTPDKFKAAIEKLGYECTPSKQGGK